MNRRSFFNKLGAAIIGTAIALKIPDNLVPKTPEFIITNTPYYEFGWTGYAKVKGIILAQINLQVLEPRMSRTIYIENC